jgi:hypothetical protein
MNLPFRDGAREVPDHIGLWMRDIDTARLTYEEALAEMNKKQESDFLNRAAGRFVMSHFRDTTRES